MIHANPPPNIVESRTFSRPPLQTIPTNPLQYNLSSTNTHSTQHSIYSLEYNIQTATSSNSIQYQNISIAEPIKPFDGLDHKCTPEEYLQHIKACVTFSLGLQPSTSHEYILWRARRMAFLQCYLTGTALSWFIRLNDTYKQDWSAFVQAFKNHFSSQKNAYYAQVGAITLVNKDNETVRHFALKVQQLVEKS